MASTKDKHHTHTWRNLFSTGEFICVGCGKLAYCPGCCKERNQQGMVRYCEQHADMQYLQQIEELEKESLNVQGQAVS